MRHRHLQPREKEYIDRVTEDLKGDLFAGSRGSVWARLTRDYTLREVTYDKDTFPAIAGIVQRIQKLTGDTYYAGLWKSQFFNGLLWYHYRHSMNPMDNFKRADNPRDLRKRQVWTAPSWSWASVKGTLDYYSGASTRYNHPCARLDECNITRSGPDPFGAITSGYARITGPITLVTDIEAEDDYSGLHPWGKVQLGNGTLAKARVMFDFGPRESCIVLMVLTYMGICIEKVEQMEDKYIRVGMVEVGGYWRFPKGSDEPVPETGYLTASDHRPPRTITLI